MACIGAAKQTSDNLFRNDSSFSTVTLWTLTALGLTPSHSNAKTFLAIWRHVGFHMGVSPTILRQYFSNINASDRFLSSMVIHLFSPDGETDTASLNAPTMPILVATTSCPPLYNTLEWNCAVTHRLLGHKLATYLKVPEPSWSMNMKLCIILAVQVVPVIFSRYYGKNTWRGWLEKRRHVYGVGMAMTLQSNLGMRRTKFRLDGKDKSHWDDVAPDLEGAARATRQFREVLAEMFAVLVGVGFLIAYATWRFQAYLIPVHFHSV
uniref:Uncharacterized protein n=1 Tax=Moniliophthora roreri TaxID=221103 RepID=A0A0W0FVB5_MONRR